MCVQGPSCHCWVLSGWPDRVEGNSFPKLRHLPGDSNTPWYAIPAVPEVHLRFGVCSFVNVTFVFVSCLFFSWAKQHWETRTRDPLLKNQ